MEDAYAPGVEGDIDARYTPYPALVPCADYRIRETDAPDPPGDHPSPPSARRQLARALRRHRLLRGWSEEALGVAAGLDRSYVGAVERMEVNISFDNAEKLARALGLELVELLGSAAPTDCR